MIDNFDSFTFNLVHYLQEMDLEVKVVMNNQIEIAEVELFAPSHIIISPGPGQPKDAGISSQLVARFKGEIPILGVCLGHQVIAEHFGAKVALAPQVMHGKTSLIKHQQEGIFKALKQPFVATRYHSLVIDAESLTDDLKMTAWTESEHGELDQIMAVQHKHYPIFGVQFHPESVLTECGRQLLANFLVEA